jgi:succinyl-diaminopimelate desuccinylase
VIRLRTRYSYCALNLADRRNDSSLGPKLMSRMILFLREILQIRSLSGNEREVADRVIREMTSLGFDRAEIDDLGNVIALVRGREAGAGWLLVTHLDHVHEGSLEEWTHPPYDAVLRDGVIFGRGAVDIKGPLAAQLYALGRLIQRGESPRRDVYVVACTKEETDGSGAAHAIPKLKGSVATSLIGEPSGNRLILGHRGVAIVEVVFRGSAHHASDPREALNPHYALATFLSRLQQADKPLHSLLGSSSISPTLIECDTKSASLTPNSLRLTLKWLNALPECGSERPS